MGRRGQVEEIRPDQEQLPLQTSHVDQPITTINRVHILTHFSATLALLYYRATRLPQQPSGWPLLSWALLLASDLLLFFLWVLVQAFRWRPVTRTVFPERLPEEDDGRGLPPIDIFICTADPEKEPTMEVMNTLVSAMCLDYPWDKLHVYLSDDGGSPLTLHAAKEAYSFARSWLPFCKRYDVQTRSPEAYFGSEAAHGVGFRGNSEFLEEQHRIKLNYEALKESVKKAKDTIQATQKGGDRLPHIQIIQDEQEANGLFREQEKIPLLVYVSREKRKSHPHHFKAGALNVLLRVSSTLSNSPYILVLDCDMYCNNPTSARQAMCLHLDPHLKPSLAFVQFPQTFQNISKNDIYSAELRTIFKIFWKGCDGLRGPILSGTGFYIKREALYGAKPGQTSREEFDKIDIAELKQRFGTSNELIASLRHNLRSTLDNRTTLSTWQSEAKLLASCPFETDTQWGEKIGFLYGSVVEDYFTGFHMHCRGWISTYLYPKRQAFLGSFPIDFNDTLVQNRRWACGLLEVAFSRFCPLTFGVRSRMSLLQTMCYAWLAFQPLYSFALICYGIIPQVCFLNGISLFPHVSNPWFAIFAMVYTSSMCQHLMEVFLYGGLSLRMWANEQRFWMITSVTSQLFACLSIIMKLVGLGEIHFDLTNKATAEEQIQRYEKGIFDFGGSSPVLIPSTVLTILNVITFTGGLGRAIVENNLGVMAGQLFLSVVILVFSYPLLEGMIARKDSGRVPTSITMISIIIPVILLLFVWLSY